MAYNQPNYGYPQYGYQNQFNYQYGQQISQPQLQQNIYPTIYGKVVDGIDVVKSLDIPIGTSFILPKASGEIIYAKGWNPDGTTFVKEYALVDNVQESGKNLEINIEEKLNEIYNCIDSLNNKIDKFKPLQSPTRKKKVIEEVDEDE